MKIIISEAKDIKKFTAYGNNSTDTTPLFNEELGYAKVSENPSGFLAEDFRASHPNINAVEIIDIYVYPKFRHQGVGSKLLNEIAKEYGAIGNSYNSNTVILAAAAASMKEYPEEPSTDELIKISEGLIPFYTKNGFRDVNGYYAGYETKRALMYASALGLKCINERKAFVDEFNAEMKARYSE